MISMGQDSEDKGAAERRLKALSNQVAPASEALRKPRKKRQKGPEAPADWSDMLAEINKVREYAATPNINSTGYKRHKEAGKLWVRERIELLVDPGSFREVGSLAGTVKWINPEGPKSSVIEEERQVVGGFTPSNNVQGKAIV